MIKTMATKVCSQVTLTGENEAQSFGKESPDCEDIALQRGEI